MARKAIRYPYILGVRFYARIEHGLTFTGAYIKSTPEKIHESFVVPAQQLADHDIFADLIEAAYWRMTIMTYLEKLQAIMPEIMGQRGTAAAVNILEKLQRDECPKCDYHLDLQTVNYGVFRWCPSCRVHFREADWRPIEETDQQ